MREPGLRVIVGPNGSGKSKLLRAIQAVAEVMADPYDSSRWSLSWEEAGNALVRSGSFTVATRIADRGVGAGCGQVIPRGCRREVADKVTAAEPRFARAKSRDGPGSPLRETPVVVRQRLARCQLRPLPSASAEAPMGGGGRHRLSSLHFPNPGRPEPGCRPSPCADRQHGQTTRHAVGRLRVQCVAIEDDLASRRLVALPLPPRHRWIRAVRRPAPAGPVLESFWLHLTEKDWGRDRL